MTVRRNRPTCADDGRAELKEVHNMRRTEYLGSLIDTLPTLTDSQVEYLYYLVEELFGVKKSETSVERSK